MSEKIVEKRSFADILGDVISKNRKIIVSVCAVLILAVIVYAVAVTVNSKSVESGLAKIDEITYTLTNKSSDLSESDLNSRMEKALGDLNSMVGKGGVVGVRANMLVAEIYFQKKDFEKARSSWIAAAEKGKKSYTAPLSYFNAAVCSEELNDVDSAVTYYGDAAKAEDFFESDHALFSEGRVLETKGDFAAAQTSYQKVVDASPDTSWAKLAKDRLIALKNDGKIE